MILWIFFALKLIHESQADTVAKELSSHIQSLWDQYFISKLNGYTFNGNNVDIAGILFFPPVWNSRWFSLISGISRVPDLFRRYYFYGFQHFLCDFLEDRARSGKYHVNGRAYAHAALECLRNMVNPNDE